MPLTAVSDCTTPLEDAKLSYAGKYSAWVSPNMNGLGATNLSWPPGQRPEPYKWTDPKTGDTWTLVQFDAAWRYRNSRTKMFISPSNLYDIMGIAKDANTGAAIPNQVIPGIPNPPPPGLAPPSPQPTWPTWALGGLGTGWVILGAVGIVYAVKSYKKKKRGG